MFLTSLSFFPNKKAKSIFSVHFSIKSNEKVVQSGWVFILFKKVLLKGLSDAHLDTMYVTPVTLR